jgi:hypothetical protein
MATLRPNRFYGNGYDPKAKTRTSRRMIADKGGVIGRGTPET